MKTIWILEGHGERTAVFDSHEAACYFRANCPHVQYGLPKERAVFTKEDSQKYMAFLETNVLKS